MTAIVTPRHRVSVATAHVHAELDAVTDASVWSMDAAETASTLVALERAEARLAELKARVAAHADDVGVGSEVAASSTANWLAHLTRTTRAAAHASVRLGHDLDAHDLTRAALAAGDLTAEQARVIIRWIDQLPTDLDAEVIERGAAPTTPTTRPPTTPTATSPSTCGRNGRTGIRHRSGACAWGDASLYCSGMLIWLNGPFGGGKTATAYELAHRLDPEAVVCDPEHVGFGLHRALPPALRVTFRISLLGASGSSRCWTAP